MSSRNPWLDQIKGVACLLIVVHHLAFYGPMADHVWPAAPAVMEWLQRHARMAVQIFLVLGGYLAAATLAPQGLMPKDTALPALWGKRYLRLSLPFGVALATALLVNETVRALGFAHDSVSAEANVWQVLAHMLLLHSIGGWESLSAGVWYVAIDFQLFALSAAWLWLAAQVRSSSGVSARAVSQGGVLALTAASLWFWNRDSDLDIWAIYFLGAYGLGMMAWWAAHAPAARMRWAWSLAMLAITAVALLLDWRSRIALAGAMALMLATAGHVPWPRGLRTWSWRPLVWLGWRAYSVFLIHFPVCLLVNAIWARVWPGGVLIHALGMGVAVLASVLAGHWLYQAVESQRASWGKLLGLQAGVLLALSASRWIG